MDYVVEVVKEVFENIKPTDGVVVGMFPPDGEDSDIVAENAAFVEAASQPQIHRYG